MALTFSTGMTLAHPALTGTDGIAVANWSEVIFAGAAADQVARYDTQNTATAATGCISMGHWAASANYAILYDYFTANANAVLNLATVGNEVLAIWVAVATPGTMANLSAGGLYVIASSSTDVGTTAPTAYFKWYVSGKDVMQTSRATVKDGWFLILIDTRKAASATVLTPSLTSIHRIGIGCLNNTTPPVPGGSPAPADLFVGSIWYGRPRYQVIGDGATTATWALMQAHSATTNYNGLIEDMGGGVYRASCGLRLGSSTQAATTTFSDSTSTSIVFKRQTYYTTSEVDALNYTDYYNIDAQGAASFNTSLTLGSVVGAGDSRQGVGGGSFLTGDQTNVTYNADFATNIANLSAVNMYGVRWVGAKGGIKFDSTKTTVVTNTYQRSGEVDCGATLNGATLLNCTVIDPEGGTAQNNGLKLPSVHNIKNVGFITSGTPTTQHMLDLSTSGSYSVTMDNLQFYGTYSGTVLHGDLSSVAQTTVTGTALNGANPNATLFSKTGNVLSTITINNAKTLKVTVKNTAGTAIQDAQVYINKLKTDTDFGHPGKPFTAGAGNAQGNGTFVVTEAVPSDLPAPGWISVQRISLGSEQPYRYTSKSGSTFTFNTAVTGADVGTGNATTINETGIGAKNIVEGDTIRNTTNLQWAIVLLVSTNSVTTTTLSGSGTWAAKSYSVHTLAFAYTSATDTASVPLLNGDTNASGIITDNYNFTVNKDVVAKVRKASGGTDYLPYSSTQTITTTGLDLAVTLTVDIIKT